MNPAMCFRVTIVKNTFPLHTIVDQKSRHCDKSMAIGTNIFSNPHRI